MADIAHAKTDQKLEEMEKQMGELIKIIDIMEGA